MEQNPHQLAESRIHLSEEYSRYSGELAKLIQLEAQFWKDNKDTYKSDTATQRAFNRTEEGIKMTVIKLKMKSITKMLSSYQTMIEVKTNEAKGFY